MRTYLFLLVFLLCFPFLIFSQNQNQKWYFGNGAALDFSGGSPVSLTSNVMTSVEGCASVSDTLTGNLLFYTNGIQVWTATHSLMPNGNGLLAGASTSATQGVLIVMYPQNPNKYLLFTTDETSNSPQNGLRYSVIDMSLNGGLGDVVVGQKNILLQANCSERLAITHKAGSNGFWLMTHKRNSNEFDAFEISASGVNPVPVTSSVGATHSTIQQANGDETMGYLKFNHQGNKLAIALYAGNKVQVFDFDNCTGIVSNPITINTLDNPYGVEFSPDDSRLYYSLYYNATFEGAVFQANMLAANIATSSVLIGVSSSLNFQCMGALQLAPDGKIYVAINSESWLSAIAQPNILGVACGFIDQAVALLSSTIFPKTSLLGLPQNVLKSTYSPPCGGSCNLTASIVNNIPAACNANNGSATITAANGVSPYNYSWSNGQLGASASNLASGTYTCYITDALNCQLIQTVNIGASTSLSATAIPYNLLCNGIKTGSVKVIVNNGIAPFTYSWSSGITTDSISGLLAGTYSCVVTDAAGCTTTVSATVSQPPAILLVGTSTNNTGTNNGTATVTASGGTPPYTYTWQTTPPQYTQTITGLASGNYICFVEDANGCRRQTIIIVTGSSSISSEMIGMEMLSIVPNPSDGAFALSMKFSQANRLRLSLWDLTGKMIFAEEKENIATYSQNFSFPTLSKGIYYLKIQGDKGEIIEKVIIE